MANFEKLKRTRLSIVLESIEQERVLLCEMIFTLSKGLAAAFVLLSATRFCLLAIEFGWASLLDWRVPLMTVLTAIIFMVSFAFAVSISFVVSLTFSSALGMSVPLHIVRAVFAGLTAFLLVVFWQSHIPWFFAEMLPNPFAWLWVAAIAMLMGNAWQPPNLVGNLRTNPLQIKHLLTVTAFLAVGLASIQIVPEGKDKQIMMTVATYITFQSAAILIFSVRWPKLAERVFKFSGT